MSWYATGWLKSCHFGGRGIHKGIALVVGDYCNADGRAAGIDVAQGWEVCWAGYDVLAIDSEWEERTVRRCIADLSEAGIFVVKRRHDPRTGHRTTDAIFLQLQRPFVVVPDGWESSRERKERDQRDRTRHLGRPAGQALADPGSGRASGDRLPDPGVTAYRTPGSPPTGPRGPFPHTPYKEEPPLEPQGNHHDHPGYVTTAGNPQVFHNPGSSQVAEGAAPAPPAAARWRP